MPVCHLTCTVRMPMFANAVQCSDKSSKNIISWYKTVGCCSNSCCSCGIFDKPQQSPTTVSKWWKIPTRFKISTADTLCEQTVNVWPNADNVCNTSFVSVHNVRVSGLYSVSSKSNIRNGISKYDAAGFISFGENIKNKPMIKINNQS